MEEEAPLYWNVVCELIPVMDGCGFPLCLRIRLLASRAVATEVLVCAPFGRNSGA